ncbi:MAG: lysylphosphatidylglycerol synthase domain-containing protein [Bacteroidetes bacterium]|nr:lysylphosphatidylglycerol synthase domain-containing protein [Bacteroidota bacterium]
MKTKIKKTYNILIRILILAGTYGFLYKKIFQGKDWQQQFILFRELMERPGIKILVYLVVFLMLVNWGLESQKWRYMIGKIEKISFYRSVQAVFAGVSISFFTPNRTGEYFGRAFILDKASHVDGILITILGSMSQLLITILAGTVSMLVFVPRFLSQNEFFSGYLYYGLVVLILIIDLLLLFLVVNVQFLSVLRDKLLRSKLKKFRKHLAVFADFRARDMAYVIGLSFLRYLVFTGQFLLLLKVFSVPVPVFDGIIIISLIFFVLSVVPTVAITELGVRGSAAVYFFGLWFSHTSVMSDSILIGILSATTLLWIINLAIPAVIGTLFVFRLKFFRKVPQGI